MKTLSIVALALALSSAVAAKSARTIRLNEKRTEFVYVTPGHSTVLSFPSRPTKVVLGNKGAFTVQYVENDLAVSALSFGAKSNLFIYLDGRRFGFNLRAVSDGGDEIVMVRDMDEDKWKVKVQIND